MYNISVLGGHSAVSQNALAGMLTSITITTWSEEQSIAWKIHFASTKKYTIVLELVVFVELAITIPIKQTIAGTTCNGRNLLELWKLWTGPHKVQTSTPSSNFGATWKINWKRKKESLWLELQNAWDNISVEVLRKYMWHYAREMCCCNIHYLVYCCAQNNHLHVSWTFTNEIMFWRQKRSVKYFNNFGHHCIYPIKIINKKNN